MSGPLRPLQGNLTRILQAPYPGFWSIHLNKPRSLLTTFNTQKGRYRFLRIPFGLKMSPDVIQMEDGPDHWQVTWHHCPQWYFTFLAQPLKNMIKIYEDWWRQVNEKALSLTAKKDHLPVFTQHGMKLNIMKVQASQDLHTSTNQKEL